MSQGVDPEGSIGVIAESWEGVRGAELLRARLPKEDFLVVADQAFAPYARRRPDQVRQRVQDLASGLYAEGAKALLLAGGFASFEARPTIVELPMRGLECGLRDALQQAAGRPIVAVFAASEVKTMVLAKQIRTLRGGGSVTLIERGVESVSDLMVRVRQTTPDVLVLLLLTPSAYADWDELVAAVPELVVVDALDSAARHLAHDLRTRQLLAHHGLRAGRITAFATRGGTTGATREPLSTASIASLQRRS